MVTIAELFDPQTLTFEALSSSLLPSLTYHTATLLTDGRVLIAGGRSQGNPSTVAYLWNPQTLTHYTLETKLTTARHGHTAALLADGSVLLWGGRDHQGHFLNQGERYDPISQRFSPLASIPSTSLGILLEGSLPKEGAVSVSVHASIALRFSHPLRVKTVTPGTVKLVGPAGAVAIDIIAAEAGRLVFITPRSALLAGATYSVIVDGATDLTGAALSFVGPTFTTEKALGVPLVQPGQPPALLLPIDDNQARLPDDASKARFNGRGKRVNSPWQSLRPLQAKPGVTALAGQVLKLNGRPLAHVRLQVGNKATRTDASGRFLLTSLTPGRQLLIIDGSTASSKGKTYGMFEVQVEVAHGKTNILPYTSWLPLIDTRHATPLPVPTRKAIVVTTPRIPGLEIHIPRGVTLRTGHGHPLTSLSITPIPVDRPPFPLPPGTQFFFTPQTHGATVEVAKGASNPGIRIVFPNYARLPAGARIDLWSYDAAGTGWYRYGQGSVTRDGKQIIPDAGVALQRLTCIQIFEDPDDVPDEAPPPDDDEDNEEDNDDNCEGGAGGGGCEGNPATDGDPVDLATGLLVDEQTDLALPDVLPITLTRTYRQNDPISRAFGVGASHPYELFLTGDSDSFSYAELILADGGRIRYDRISPGTNYDDAVMEHTATPSAFYQSLLAWNPARGGWDITLKDGTIYLFESFFDATWLYAIRDRQGNQVTLLRDLDGRISSLLLPHGRQIQLTYDDSDRIIQAKDNIGRTVSYRYDTSGRLTKVTDPLGGTTDYTYDTLHRMLTLKNPRGIVYLANEYDAHGRVIKQTQADGGVYRFAYTLDADGNVTQTDVTDPRGQVRRVTFNSAGYPLSDTRALGTPEQQRFSYVRQAGSHWLLSMTDPLGRRTTYTYDAKGNKTSITQLAGTAEATTTRYTYEPVFSQITSLTDPLNHTTTFTYDAKGNVIRITDPLGQSSTVSYNPAGQPLSLTDALGNTTRLRYDDGDLTQITDPLERTTTRYSDDIGRLESLTNPLGHRTRYDYDALNRLVKTTDARGGITAFTYDANDNRLSLSDARGSTTRYTYNSKDQVISRKDPLLLTETYAYDANDNQTRFTDRKNQITQVSYDALERRIQTNYADASTVIYTYDKANRITQIVDSTSGTITRSYDDLNRLLSETTAQGAVSYTYDAAGRRTSMSVAGQPTITYSYDAADRLIQLSQGASTVSFGYDATGRRTKLILPNGVETRYDYDAASQLTGLTYKKGSTTLGNLIYTYDVAGRRIQTGGSLARTGLPEVVPNASYNAANQMLSFGTQTLSYDANGNLLGDGAKSYTWDVRDQLAAISGEAIGSFQYDGAGRRQNKTLSGANTGFLYDELNPIQELTGNTPKANLLTGLGIDEIFTRTDATGTRSLLTDALGSTLALTDPSGAVQTEYTYEPFGKTTQTGAANSNSHQYTGRENDTTGLYYYRARYYHPTLQRFISEDPRRSTGSEASTTPPA